jgi:hypothetical protein
LIYFYPERLDLISQLETLASDLGGRLQRPRLPWKYAWIKSLFGWTCAKQVQQALQGTSVYVFSHYWDKALYWLENLGQVRID